MKIKTLAKPCYNRNNWFAYCFKLLIYLWSCQCMLFDLHVNIRNAGVIWFQQMSDVFSLYLAVRFFMTAIHVLYKLSRPCVFQFRAESSTNKLGIDWWIWQKARFRTNENPSGVWRDWIWLNGIWPFLWELNLLLPDTCSIALYAVNFSHYLQWIVQHGSQKGYQEWN